jgi:protein O-mannosyl-transferase
VAGYGFLNVDDDVYVSSNTHVWNLTWDNMRWAFTNLDAGFWHPLTWISLMFDSLLFGVHPAGYHLTNLLLHIASSVLLFLLLRQLTGALWRSAMVATLFALHPLHVESVAWIAERKDVLSTLFWMLTLLAYVRYSQSTIGNRQSAITNYSLALIFFTLGLMSKSMLVTLPVVMLLLDFWPLQRISCFQTAVSKTPNRQSAIGNRQWLLWEKLPFFALSFAAGLLTIQAEKGIGALSSTVKFPLSARLENATLSTAHYLGQTFWPADLAVFYPYPKSFAIWSVVGAGLLLLVISAGAFWARRQRGYLLLGWLWYGITLLPVSGLIQVGGHARADRYTYVPLIGIFLILVWGVVELWTRWRLSKLLGMVLAVVILLACGLRAADQLACWQDSGTLFRHALTVTGDNDFADGALGFDYLENGNLDEAMIYCRKAITLNPNSFTSECNLAVALTQKKQYVEAIEHYQRAWQLAQSRSGPSSDRLFVFLGYGNALKAMGKIDEAIAQFQEALRLNSDFPATHNSLGVALALQHKYDEAIEQYRAALRVKPDYSEAENNLGLALAAQGRPDEAIARYEAVLQAEPDNIDAHNSLGGVLLQAGRVDEAVEQLAWVLKRKPGQADAYASLGAAFAAQGRLDEAIGQFREAIRYAPDVADSHFNLANALAMQHNLDEAVQQYTQTLHLSPDNARAHCNLGYALLELGRKDEAVSQLREAVRIQPDLAPAVQKLRELGAPTP